MVRRLIASLVLVTLTLGSVACQKQVLPDQLQQANAAFAAGDYRRSYRLASHMAEVNRVSGRDDAALIAGLSAQRLGNTRAAERFLIQAAHSRDAGIAGDALASLGLLYSEQGRYDKAADVLLLGAQRLSGQSRANAYFYAAIAQQKLGRTAQARDTFVLARNNSRDPQFIQRVNEMLDVTGYTLQIGAFKEPENARRAAEEIAERAISLRLGYPKIVGITGRDGEPMSAVQVGSFATFDSASQVRTQLGESTMVVPLSQ